jgi:hypothetical protein
MHENKTRKISPADIPYSQRKEATPAEKRRIIAKLNSIKFDSPFSFDHNNIAIKLEDDPYYCFIQEQIKKLEDEITPSCIKEQKR